MTTPTVTKQVLENGNQNYVAIFTCPLTLGDTLADYVAIDPTATGDMGVSIAGNTLYPGVHTKIMRLSYDMSDGVAVQLIWDATSPQNAVIINGTGSGKQDFRQQGGLFVPQSAGAPIAGATGKILFTVLGTPAAGDFFSINMWCHKSIHQ